MEQLTLDDLFAIEVVLQSNKKQEEKKLFNARMKNPTIDDDNYIESSEEMSIETNINKLEELKAKVKRIAEELGLEINPVTVHD